MFQLNDGFLPVSMCFFFFILSSFRPFACSMPLKCPFNFTLRKKLFKSYLSCVLLYTSLVGTKFKILFNSLYTFLEKGNSLKFIAFLEESC